MDDKKEELSITTNEEHDLTNDGMEQSRYRIKKRGRRKKYFRFSMITLVLVAVASLAFVFTGNENHEIAENPDTESQEDEEVVTSDPKIKSTEVEGENETDNKPETAVTNENETGTENSIEENKESSVETGSDDTTENHVEEVDSEQAIEPESENKVIEHEIQNGDTLYQLSIQYYDTSQYQQFLAAYNNIGETETLHIGDVVKIPFPPVDEWHVETENETTAVSSDLRYHEVKAGDTLYSISERYYKTPKHNDFIAKYNNITNPGDLKIGDKIVIPDSPPGSE